MSTSNLLFFRLAEFLRVRKETIAKDATGALPPSAASAFPWQRKLASLVQETSDRLMARAAMVENGPIEPVPLEEGDGENIKTLLEQGSAVRHSFVWALNRFQVEQAENHEFTRMEVTEARQETLAEFDELLTASLATWISRECARTSSLDPHALHEVYEGMKAVLGLLRMAVETVPPQARKHVSAAAQQLARLTTRMEEATGVEAGEAASVPAPAAAPAPAPAQPLPLPKAAPASAEPLRVAPLHVGSFIRTLSDAFRPAAEGKGLRFEARCAPVPEIIATDAAKLHRAATLLLNHSVHQTHAGSIVVTAGLHSQDRWVLGVRDSGPTMPNDALSRLLLGLGTSDPGTDSDSTLGIALARDLADLLGGSFEAESKDGMQYRILLPVR